ncbi:hypothetical protein MASR2M78_26860 [Treponema sp.]
MNLYIFPLIALALFAVLRYFRGNKQNRWLSGCISAETEAILNPKDTNYVNIGGSIGYNFTYQLSAPLKEAKGTFALIPRHSAFYLPVVFLVGGKDRYFLTIYSKEKLIGEGHIIEEKYFSKISETIDGIAKLKRDRVSRGKKNYILLWDNPKLEAKLKELIQTVEQSELLRHFCCFRDNSNFYLFMQPKKDGVTAVLGSIYPQFKKFWEGKNNGGTET